MATPAPSPRSGFTLVELLVAATISLALLGVVIAGYRHFISRRALLMAGEEMKNNLRLLRSKAIHGEKPSGCETLRYYKINFSGKNLSWDIYCSDADGGEVIFNSAGSINLETEAEVTADNFPYLIYPLTGTVDQGASLVFSYMDRSLTLTIDSDSGAVSLGEITE